MQPFAYSVLLASLTLASPHYRPDRDLRFPRYANATISHTSQVSSSTSSTLGGISSSETCTSTVNLSTTYTSSAISYPSSQPSSSSTIPPSSLTPPKSSVPSTTLSTLSSPRSSSTSLQSNSVVAIIPAVPKDPLHPSAFDFSPITESLTIAVATITSFDLGTTTTAPFKNASSTVTEEPRIPSVQSIGFSTPDTSSGGGGSEGSESAISTRVLTALPSTVAIVSGKAGDGKVTGLVVTSSANAVAPADVPVIVTGPGVIATSTLISSTEMSRVTSLAALKSSGPSAGRSGGIAAVVSATINDPSGRSEVSSTPMTRSSTFVLATSSFLGGPMGSSQVPTNEDAEFDETVTLFLSVTTTLFSRRVSSMINTPFSITDSNNMQRPTIRASATPVSVIASSTPAQGDTFPLIQQSPSLKSMTLQTNSIEMTNQATSTDYDEISTLFPNTTLTQITPRLSDQSVAISDPQRSSSTAQSLSSTAKPSSPDPQSTATRVLSSTPLPSLSIQTINVQTPISTITIEVPFSSPSTILPASSSRTSPTSAPSSSNSADDDDNDGNVTVPIASTQTTAASSNNPPTTLLTLTSPTRPSSTDDSNKLASTLTASVMPSSQNVSTSIVPNFLLSIIPVASSMSISVGVETTSGSKGEALPVTVYRTTTVALATVTQMKDRSI